MKDLLKFEKIAENESYEFGHYGLSKGISEHISKLNEGHFCLVSKNKNTNDMRYLIFNDKQNIIREDTKAENLLYWIDALLLDKYGEIR